ncbi:hypothetical protein SVIOM342S_09391 [Streptomyces violaceorubidus]
MPEVQNSWAFTAPRPPFFFRSATADLSCSGVNTGSYQQTGGSQLGSTEVRSSMDPLPVRPSG